MVYCISGRWKGVNSFSRSRQRVWQQNHRDETNGRIDRGTEGRTVNKPVTRMKGQKYEHKSVGTNGSARGDGTVLGRLQQFS
jgi:hypothetical protein